MNAFCTVSVITVRAILCVFVSFNKWVCLSSLHTWNRLSFEEYHHNYGNFSNYVDIEIPVSWLTNKIWLRKVDFPNKRAHKPENTHIAKGKTQLTLLFSPFISWITTLYKSAQWPVALCIYRLNKPYNATVSQFLSRRNCKNIKRMHCVRN